MKNNINKTLIEVVNSFKRINSPDIEEGIHDSYNLMIKALKNRKKIIFCGNGGSAADSQHLAAELVGKYKYFRQAIPALSITCDTSAITSIGNDMGFEHIFSRQIEAVGESGDILFAMSTSGTSKNILNAIIAAKKKKIKIIFLTSQLLKKKIDLCDIIIKVPSIRVDRIQEMHISIGHIICELIETKFK